LINKSFKGFRRKAKPLQTKISDLQVLKFSEMLGLIKSLVVEKKGQVGVKKFFEK